MSEASNPVISVALPNVEPKVFLHFILFAIATYMLLRCLKKKKKTKRKRRDLTRLHQRLLVTGLFDNN